MNSEDRITELESKVAFQDDTIDTLNDVIIHQQSQIDELKKELIKLSARLQSVQEISTTPAQNEPPPPHY